MNTGLMGKQPVHPEAAVRQWVYRPTLLNGNPVDRVTEISVNFTLSQREMRGDGRARRNI